MITDELLKLNSENTISIEINSQNAYDSYIKKYVDMYNEIKRQLIASQNEKGYIYQEYLDRQMWSIINTANLAVDISHLKKANITKVGEFYEVT